MEEQNTIEEIKKLVKDKRLVVGTENTLKKLKNNKVGKIWLSSNAPAGIKEDIHKYAEMNNVAVIELAIPNDDLGVLCKRQYSVSVLSLLRGEK